MLPLRAQGDSWTLEDDNDPALRLYADSGYAMIKGYCALVLPLDPEPR